ncbi:MAG: signal recognition particle-docking protein FtsY [Proteobacteria bacterium]|nr:signal recognition particle-docking protein FtsY [Pseudomonadota bacterium]
MLGWFKKKFKKQDEAPPRQEEAVDELCTDTSFSAPDQLENTAENLLSIKNESDAGTDLATLPPIADRNNGIEKPVLTPPPAEPILPPAGPKLKIIKESNLPKVKEIKKKSLISRLAEKLSKTRESFTYQIDALFLGKKQIDAAMLDDLEEILITADLGVETSMELLEYVRRRVKRQELSDPNSLKEALKEKIKSFITENDKDASLVMPDTGPFVIMVIGVNGVGKTTTIGKIAHKFQQAGHSILLVAADTFRAAAVSQLQIWGERNKVQVIAHKEGADPSSVVFDALSIAQSKKIDVVLVDTAGRLHTNSNLMEELKKIKRVMAKKLIGAPHEVLLVIDATTGQNGISQAKLFNEAIGVTGLTLTKLDGTSKGGIVVNICRGMKIPIRFIGIGEHIDDLRDFDPEEFADALFQSRKDQV